MQAILATFCPSRTRFRQIVHMHSSEVMVAIPEGILSRLALTQFCLNKYKYVLPSTRLMLQQSSEQYTLSPSSTYFIMYWLHFSSSNLCSKIKAMPAAKRQKYFLVREAVSLMLTSTFSNRRCSYSSSKMRSMQMKDRMNRVQGKLSPSTKCTFTNSEKLNAPISTAFTETNFITIFYYAILYQRNHRCYTLHNLPPPHTLIFIGRELYRIRNYSKLLAGSHA